jgi:hypothetical protein
MQEDKSVVNLSWRIGVGSYETDEAFGQLKDLLLEYKDIVDEIAFFETMTHHLYFPLEVFADRADILKRRIQSLKESGIARVGINVLCTVGHVNEGWDYMPALPFQAMVGHDGSVSKSCGCPNTDGLREYIYEKYRLMAQAAPDFIWVDDDIRMQMHGVAWACFCPTCIEIFNKTTGNTLTREEIVAAFDRPEDDSIRKAWVEQNCASLESLMGVIKRAIDDVNPQIRKGLMTIGPGWVTYSGQDLNRWMTALGATKTRPGGGFYSDDAPMGMVHKAFECSRQLVGLPDSVTDKAYELENFPYSAFSKSVTSLINECTLALSSGMNGIAMNALGAHTPYIAEERRPIMNAVRDIRNYWEQIAQASQGCKGTGLWPAWSTHTAANREVQAGEKWIETNIGDSYSYVKSELLAELGLPITPEASGDGTILVGRMPEAFSNEELKSMLAGGVFMDAAALNVLHSRGLGELTGVRVARSVDNGVKECMTDDPLNGRYAGHDRWAMIEFWGDAKGLGEILEPVAPGVRVLENMVTYLEKPYGPCMTAYENPLGGRVVVAGYGPWMYLGTAAKRTQLQNVADWISRGSTPVRIDEMAKIVPFVRLSNDRQKGMVLLLNASFDTIKEATIHVRTPAAPAELVRPDRSESIMATQESGGWQFTVKDLAPWSTAAVIVGK